MSWPLRIRSRLKCCASISVAAFQKGLYWYLQESWASDVDALLPKLREFLSEIEISGPEPIARSAREWKERDAGRSRELLAFHWRSASPGTSSEVMLAWLFLQPYAEHLAERTEYVPEQAGSALCPLCSRRPVVGVLRPEGDGAKRSLI